MGVAISCPRCGGPVRPPDMMHSEWRCDDDGAVLPIRVAEHISEEIVESACAKVRHDLMPNRTPLWCPWPQPRGWMVTGVAWVGDDRSGVRATAVACSGPGLIEDGPADIVIVAEEPGIGLGTRFAGVPGSDPSAFFDCDPLSTTAHAKVRASGWPTPLWMLKSSEDRCAFVGEARGMWLYVLTWPAAAGYVLLEDLALQDLAENVPSQLLYGAPSPYLHGRA